jgi:cyclophilin family peptidyl-prolyl cis-trans isomerase
MRTPHVLLAAGAALALTLSACGSDGTASSNTAAGATTTISASGGPVTTCAKADGSSPKTNQFTAAPPMCLQPGKKYTATIETNHGTVHVALRDDIAPNTVNSFVNLARFHYFDGTTCHRAIKNFVVQCGDPTATGTGGPGYEFADELTKIEPYQVGSLAMANSGANTNGSQFFIITGSDGAALPPKYTLFGQVDAKDMSVVAALDKLGNPADGPPLSPIDIKSITVTEA